MKKTNILLLAVLALTVSFTACKGKLKDADIKTAVENAIAATPDASGVTVAIEKGVATLTGNLKDEALKSQLTDIVSKIKGVKSVVNNATVAPPVVVTADDPLTQAVTDALKAFPGVSATVKEGIITVTGAIAKADRQKLMMALQALKPKKVDVAGLTNK